MLGDGRTKYRELLLSFEPRTDRGRPSARGAFLWRVAVPAIAAALLMAPMAQAQTIGGSVQQHADEHLKPKKKKKKKKSASHPPSGNRGAQPPPRTWQPPPDDKPKGPDLPLRVIGRDLQLDPQIGGGYRGWYAQQYPTVDVANQAYFTWALQMRARFFRLISLERGYYESNGINAPRHKGASIAAQAGNFVPKTVRVLGIFGLDLGYVLEPIVRYETRAHQTTATPEKPVRIIPRSASASQQNTDFPLTQEPLKMVSAYETFVVAARYNPDNGKKAGLPGDVPPAYLGIGLIQYTKPYQFNVRDAVLDEFIFDAQFRGAGLALGFATPNKPDAFHLDFSGMVGMGEVRLLKDLTLNEVAADDTYIGFAQTDVTVGYLYPLNRSRPTLMLGLDVSLGGATFFFWKTKYHEDEEIDLPPLNWDVIWGTQAYLVLPL